MPPARAKVQLQLPRFQLIKMSKLKEVPHVHALDPFEQLKRTSITDESDMAVFHL